MSACKICGHEMTEEEGVYHNCGGDCLSCMARVGDAECQSLLIHYKTGEYWEQHSRLIAKILLESPQDLKDRLLEKMSEVSSVYGSKYDEYLP